MADETFTNEIIVQGIDVAEKQFKALGDAGEKAFDDIGAAATKVGTQLSGVARSIADTFNKITQSAQTAPDRFQRVVNAAQSFGNSLGSVASAATTFTTRVAGITATATAAGAGLLTLGRRAFTATSNFTQAQDMQDKALQNTRKEFSQITRANLDYQQQVRDLNKEFANGNLTTEEYAQKFQDLGDAQRDTIRNIRQMTVEQEDFDRQLQKTQALREQQRAFADLQETFGGPLATALVKLGTTLEDVRKKIVDAIGPSVAQIVDGLANAFQKNAATIESTFTAVGSAITSVVNGVIIPAFNALFTVVQTIMTAINNMFGTNISAQSVVVIGAIIASFQALLSSVGLVTGGLVALPSLFSTIAAAVKLLTSSIGLLYTAMRLLFVAFGPWGIAIAALTAALVYLATKLDWTAIINTTIAAVSSLVEATQAGIATLTTAWQGFSDFIMGIWNGVVSFFGGIWSTIQSGAQAAITFMTEQFRAFGQGIVDVFTQVKQYVVDVWNEIQSKFAAVFGDSVSATTVAAGHASGGMIRGAGTGTSDSIPIWASNGEYMVRAAAVKKYGVAFLSAINNMRFDPEAFGFALGGLISFNAPRPRMKFAEGGLVTAKGNTLNLTIGGEMFSVNADEQTMDRLERFAVRQQVRSASRKPKWHK